MKMLEILNLKTKESYGKVEYLKIMEIYITLYKEPKEFHFNNMEDVYNIEKALVKYYETGPNELHIKELSLVYNFEKAMDNVYCVNDVEYLVKGTRVFAQVLLAEIVNAYYLEGINKTDTEDYKKEVDYLIGLSEKDLKIFNNKDIYPKYYGNVNEEGYNKYLNVLKDFYSLDTPKYYPTKIDINTYIEALRNGEWGNVNMVGNYKHRPLRLVLQEYLKIDINVVKVEGEGVVEITKTGEVFTISAQDLHIVTAFKVEINRNGDNSKRLFMKLFTKEDELVYYRYSRFIMDTVLIDTILLDRLYNILVKNTENYFVDHISRNSLDNRRKNLRIATPVLNSFNRTDVIFNIKKLDEDIKTNYEEKYAIEVGKSYKYYIEFSRIGKNYILIGKTRKGLEKMGQYIDVNIVGSFSPNIKYREVTGDSYIKHEDVNKNLKIIFTK